MAAADKGLIDKLDTGLQQYYQLFNRNYINVDGIEKFKAFAEDNAFDDNDVKEELYVEDVEDCTLTEFDMDEDGKNMFPLNPPIQNETARNEEIVRILKIIAEKGQFKPKQNPIKQNETKSGNELLEMTVNITPKDIDEAIAKYQQQMTCFGKNFEKDKGLQHFLGVSEKEKIPFITYMVDCYTNDKAQYFAKTAQQKPMKLKEWSLQNEFMKRLRNKNWKIADKLESAMESYSNRIMTRLHFTPTIKIKDNLIEICEYIASVPAFIQKIIESQLAVPPFQVELLIAVKAVKSELKEDGKEEDDDDDDDDDDSSDDGKQQQQLDPNIDHIGHVQERLKLYPVTYFPQDNWDIDETQQSIDAISRFLNQRYADFRTVLSQYHKNKHDNNDNDEKKDDNNRDYKLRRTFNPKTYPQNMRFDIFVDRREDKPTNKGKKDDDKKKDKNRDQITYYEPPNDCNFILNDHVPEIGFELIRKCIIPSKDGNMTALDPMCGQLLTFMFNIEQKDEIRCYIVWNGQTMRFHGEHMLSVLPHLFEQSKENMEFVSDKQQINTVIQNFDKKTPDIHFDRFCKKLQSFNK